MHLIDNFDVFMDCPWGVVAYEFLVLETHRAKLKMFVKQRCGSKLAVEANEFITCWIYEILPNLASEFAIRVSDDIIPRMLRWSTDGDHKVRYDALNSYSVPSATHVVAFVIRDEDKPKLYALGVAEYIDSVVPPPSCLGPKTRGKRKLSFNDFSSNTSIPLHLRRSSLRGNDTSGGASNVGSNHGDEGQSKQDIVGLVVDLSKRFEKFEAKTVNKEFVETLARIESHMATIAKLFSDLSSCPLSLTNSVATISSPTEDHFEPAVEVVMPYVLGEYPKQGGLPWHEARTVYAIANINNNQWVCVEISLEEQSLTV